MSTKDLSLDGWFKVVAARSEHSNSAECNRIGSYIHRSDFWDNAVKYHELEEVSEEEAIVLTLRGLRQDGGYWR